MTRFKDFGSGKANAEPLSFQLHGEKFDCVPEVQGKILLDLVGKADVNNPSESATIITDFFKAVLQDESYARFEVLTTDKTRIVTVDTLGEIVGWLMEEYSNRPETQPGVS